MYIYQFLLQKKSKLEIIPLFCLNLGRCLNPVCHLCPTLSYILIDTLNFGVVKVPSPIELRHYRKHQFF